MNQSERTLENSNSKVKISQVLPTAPIDIKFPVNATKGDLINEKQKVDDYSSYMKENYCCLLSHSTPTYAMKYRNFERDIDSNVQFSLPDKNSMQINQCHNHKMYFSGTLLPHTHRRRTFSGSDISLTDSDIFSIIERLDSDFSKDDLYSKNHLYHCSVESCIPNVKKCKLYSYSPCYDSDDHKHFSQFHNETDRFSISAPVERVWHKRKRHNSNSINEYSLSSSTMNKEDLFKKYKDDTSIALSNSLPKHYKEHGELRSRSISENSLTDGYESSEDGSYWLWANYMYSEGLWHT